MSSTSAQASNSVAPIYLEAQTVIVPAQVVTQSLRSPTSPTAYIREPTDEYFGHTFNTATRDSRHDSFQRESVADAEALPAYTEEPDVDLPAYTLHAPEPVTLALYLFKFGFLFPPFWLFGIFILLSPLREPTSTTDDIPAWMPEKTQAERHAILEKIRTAELKWAKRCLVAFSIFITLALAGALSIFFVLHH